MKIVNKDFNDVLISAERYLSKKESFDLLKKAYEFAFKNHDGQFRKSGEPYIYHLINVAYILTELQAGPTTIAAGLLHDTIEDCNISKQQIQELFGDEVATLVEAVTKVGRLAEKSEEEFLAENHRKIFIAMAKDIRVIIIKLADRLHNMRTLQAQSEPKQKKIARETLEVYAPIAHRLGINTIKSELEDLSLKYLEPEKYLEIKSLLSQKQEERTKIMQSMNINIEKLLIDHSIPHRLSGRVKNIYSIYKKMYVKGKKFEEIYDLQALRVITDTDTHCYEVLGHIHANYRPIPGRFKDYIAMPKPNLYQSLHTTIIAEDGNIFEIQIRTEQMDSIAETGVAAHWRYKESSAYDAKTEQREIEEKLYWFRELIMMSNNEESEANAKGYMESLQKDIFEANVYLFTPKGRVIDLPAGSTPIDFAYRIHTQVGHRTTGATVNGILVPLNTELKTGDVVDIKTSNNPDAVPSEGWLKIAKTAAARNAIKKALTKYNNEQRRDDLIKLGKEILDYNIKQLKMDSKDTLKIVESKKFLEEHKFENFDSFLLAITNRSINIGKILDSIKAEEKKKEVDMSVFANRKKDIKGNNGIIVPGIDKVAITFSQCCSPIPGDKIVGYISKGQGVKVHRADCPNIQNSKNRLIDLDWDYEYFTENQIKCYADIQIVAQDRANMLFDIINKLATLKVSIHSMNANRNEQSMTAFFNMCIQVKDHQHLYEIFNVLKSTVNGIYEVERVSKN